MKSKQLEFHPSALIEVRTALTWYKAQNQTSAVKFAGELTRAFERIRTFPQRWPVDEAGVRKFVLRRFPFAVMYRETLLTIQILAVAHGHRRPGYWKWRL